MLYKCTIWSYLQDGYILLKEAYIANARNNASGTWILTSCATAVKFTYKARSVVEDLPLPHTCRHTHTHTHAHTQAPMLMRFVFLRSYDTQNCSLVARPPFSFPSLSKHTA